VKIQPQWVVTPGKLTNSTKDIHCISAHKWHKFRLQYLPTFSLQFSGKTLTQNMFNFACNNKATATTLIFFAEDKLGK
jgi:hypothetical protein